VTVCWPTEPATAGVDEAGRGPWAGPVVAAAVILPSRPVIRGLDDSKKLSPDRREALARLIRTEAVAWGLGWASAAEIDEINILQATYLAMRRALQALAVAPQHVRVDGNRLPPTADVPFQATWEAVIGGDGKDAAIAAASILAKTARDAYMIDADRQFPGYGFADHKGYGTARHRQALDTLGLTPLHRRSFEPVKSRDSLLSSRPHP
jgi:ribonuclease HII